MATKDINFDIKVNGKQLDLAKISFKDFDKVIKQAKTDLQALPLNDPRYKVLSNEIKTADKAWKDARKSVQGFNDDIEDGEGKVKSYRTQIRELEKANVALAESGQKASQAYKDNEAQIISLREKQEEMQRSTQKLDDALSNIPGPIGKIGQSMQSLESITGSAKSAIGSLTEMFPALQNAIVASGIGALVLILGVVVAAVMRAAKSFKPLQDAFASIGDAVSALFDALKPLTDFILGVFVKAIEVVAVVLGSLAQAFGTTSKGMAQMSLDLERQIKKQESLLSGYGSFLSKNYTELINLQLDYNKKKKELLDDDSKTTEQKQKELFNLQLTQRAALRDLKNAQGKEFRDIDNELENQKQVATIAGYKNEREAARANAHETDQDRIRQAASEMKFYNGRIVTKMVLIKELKKINAVGNKDTIEALEASIDEEKKRRDYANKKAISQNLLTKAELSKQEKEWNREDIKLINQFQLDKMTAIAEGLKDEEAKNLQNATIAIARLKEQHRVELDEIKRQQGENSEVYRKAKEKQAAELALAYENERKQELQYAAWIIQQEIDKNDRLATEAGKASEEYFQARKDKINSEFEKEMKLADGNANAIANARTKQYKASLDLEVERLQSKESLIQKGLDGEYENTQAFFNKQRDLENANYATQQKEYQLNFEMLENLKKDHDKKMAMINASQLQYASDYFTRRADTEKKHYGEMFKDLRLAEDMAYEARKKAAGDNAQELELIELEHAAKLKEITNQEIQAYASVATAMADSFANVANALAAVYQLESENSKKTMEERKAAFEQSKKYQKAAALLSAASGIINILTQPSTLPSPFDWIVKIANAAALGIMTAVQIKKIDSTEFNGGGGSGSGSGSSGNTLGRNYGDGGYIEGPRHAQGGVPITAEGGEAIMTRGAVTAFAPMLSMMNQMGGGKSFVNGIGKPYYDNPKSQNVAEESKPIIMKSYVVSNDMKTEMEKQSRLKDLSTL